MTFKGLYLNQWFQFLLKLPPTKVAKVWCWLEMASSSSCPHSHPIHPLFASQILRNLMHWYLYEFQLHNSSRWSCYIRFTSTTMTTELPWLQDYHDYRTTMTTELPWLQNYHDYRTTMTTGPPWLQNYHDYMTTMTTGLPWLQNYHDYRTTTTTGLLWPQDYHDYRTGSHTANRTRSKADYILMSTTCTVNYTVMPNVMYIVLQLHSIPYPLAFPSDCPFYFAASYFLLSSLKLSF